ncbi:MAG TPA: potassium channel family protein [Thermomicrobiales bacterium]|jgi:hypothetical protein
MLAFLLASLYFVEAIRDALREPKIKRTLYLVLTLLGVGTLFYHHVEHWGWLDSLYFCVITLATVGYGDFSPATREGKIFTMIYLFIGIGTLLAFIDAVASRAMARDAMIGGRDRPRLRGKRHPTDVVGGAGDAESVEVPRTD